MTVNLSLFAGAGAQFLDNSGNVLTGGLIYSYAAGTTTPLATYTSNSGVVAQPNPIILDAAGRVPGGEIWLTQGSSYKFVLKDSNSVLIGTYDNILGGNDQTALNTFIATLAGPTGSSLVGYNEGATGAVTTTVQTKLREYVSVKDFGATGDGTTDDTVAIQNAIASLGVLKTYNPNAAGNENPLISVGGGRLFFPKGKYLVKDTLKYSGGMHWFGEEWGSYINFAPTTSKNCIEENTANKTWNLTQERFVLKDMYICGANANAAIGLSLTNTQGIQLETITVSGFASKNVYIGGTGGGGYYNTILNCQFFSSPLNLHIANGSGAVTTMVGGVLSHVAGYTGATYNARIEEAGCAFINTSFEGAATTAQILDLARGTRYVNIYYEANNGIPLISRNFTQGLAGNSVIEQAAKGSIALTNFPQTASDSDPTEQYVPLTYFRGFPKHVSLVENGSFKNGFDGWLRNPGFPSYYNGVISLDADTFYNSSASLKFTSNGAGPLRTGQTIPAALLSPYASGNQRLYLHFITKVTTPSTDNFSLSMNGGGLGNKFSSSQAITYNGTNYIQYTINNPIVTASDLSFSIDFNSTTNGNTGWLYGAWATIGGQDFLAPLSQDILPLTSTPSTSAFGTWNVGDQIQNNAWTFGEPIGWICKTAGSNGNIGTVTCNTSNGTVNLTNISDVAGNLGVGMYVTIAGVTGIKKIVTLSGTTGTIDSVADASVTSAAVAYSNPVWSDLYTPT